MTPQRRENFKRLLKPRHIAFIGGRYAIIAIHEARPVSYTHLTLPTNREV